MRAEQQPVHVPGTGPDLTIVIPSFNSAEWLPSTLRAVADAAARCSWTTDILLVDDGSTDSTADVLARLSDGLGISMRVIHQENQGRFLARWAGVMAATAPLLLLLDSRVVLDANSLRYLQEHYADSGAVCWNGHVPTDSSVPLVGRFWEVPTQVFWGQYLANPRPTLITMSNFDRVPKGTGCFVAPRELFREVSEANWPEGDPRFISDDTRLIRDIASRTTGIMLDPGFAASYRPRTSVAAFLRHAALRGSLFVDSYAGSGRWRDAALVIMTWGPLVLVALLVILASLGWWTVVGLLLVVGVFLVVAALPLLALARRCSPRAALSFVIYSLPFAAVFWSGLVRGGIHRMRRPPSSVTT